ncbi:MAG: putative transposase DNA-binding domain protein [Eubacterium sp.]|jgi:putative transposase|nr:putative transposase DNA-binding domain protein [Eubacterium sp.]
MGLRTIHLKLHKPSTIKKNIINKAFINYNNAYNYLLNKAYSEIEKIESDYKSPKGTYSTLGLSKWIDSDLSAELNKFDIQPFKDSLKLDFGMTLASYFVQRKTNPSMPFPGFKHERVSWGDKLRPIYFCRYDTKRSFCLLYDRENGKFFAKLFLMNISNGKVRNNNNFSRALNYISKNDEPVKALKKETFIIVPLSFGKWQLKMLEQAVEQPEILRTARLLFKDNAYYLSLSIDLPDDEEISTHTFLGVSRGIENAVNYTVVDNQGHLVLNGTLDSKNEVNPSEQKTGLYNMANEIVEIAVRNKSMVVLQNLTGKGDKLSWYEEGNVIKPFFGCRQYNDLVRILDYKLPQKGLPDPAKVSSVDIFHRCSICGSNTKKNRFSKTMFICTTCGLSSNLDSLGSYNLSAKLIKYQNTPLKLKARRTTDGMYLYNGLIGLDLFVPRYENPFDSLKERIKEISESIEEYTNNKKLNIKDVSSIIEKLKSHDFTNIEII